MTLHNIPVQVNTSYLFISNTIWTLKIQAEKFDLQLRQAENHQQVNKSVKDISAKDKQGSIETEKTADHQVDKMILKNIPAKVIDKSKKIEHF